MRLLVVEDDRPIAEFVCKGLREAGYAVDHAADGDAAFALAVNEAYDAAVVDLMRRGPHAAPARRPRAH